jgi:hypothetical protein
MREPFLQWTALRDTLGDMGIPMSIYFDRHTTYKFPAKPTIQKEINEEEPLSEFGRALEELGVQRIYAHSPQAKGRRDAVKGNKERRRSKRVSKDISAEIQQEVYFEGT